MSKLTQATNDQNIQLTSEKSDIAISKTKTRSTHTPPNLTSRPTKNTGIKLTSKENIRGLETIEGVVDGDLGGDVDYEDMLNLITKDTYGPMDNF